MIHITSADKEQLVEVLYELAYTLVGVRNKMLKGKLGLTDDEANSVMTKVFFQAMTMDENGKENDRDGDKN